MCELIDQDVILIANKIFICKHDVSFVFAILRGEPGFSGKMIAKYELLRLKSVLRGRIQARIHQNFDKKFTITCSGIFQPG